MREFSVLFFFFWQVTNTKILIRVCFVRCGRSHGRNEVHARILSHYLRVGCGGV